MDVIWFAALFSLICVARLEHVVASNVWIWKSGHEFKAKERKQLKKKRKALKTANLPRDWKAIRLTPEERWNLYKLTGGAKFPWLFFGIRSHRLLVRGRRGPTWVKVALMVIRLAWLNWAFPVWMSLVLLSFALHSDPRGMKIAITIGAIALLLNALGTLVGSVFAAVMMGGVSQHNDNVPTESEAPNKAPVEYSYGLTAAILYLLTGAVFVQVLALLYGSGPFEVTAASLGTSLQVVLTGTDAEALGFGATWLTYLKVVAPAAFPGLTAIGMLFIWERVTSMWNPS